MGVGDRMSLSSAARNRRQHSYGRCVGPWHTALPDALSSAAHRPGRCARSTLTVAPLVKATLARRSGSCG